ncbi:MAG TPA: primosomal protein N' [Ruminiclostridium sp.]|nr:primosomal protein N' [Ruminiclostridium sp.]
MPFLDVAKVAVEGTAYHFDKQYSYMIPDDMKDGVKAGSRVVVPFGAGNKRRRGIVLAVESGEDISLKPLLALMDETPLISREMLALSAWIKEHTYCTLYEALRLMLPAGLNLHITKTYRLDHELTEAELMMLSADELCMVNHIKKAKSPVDRESLAKSAGLDEKTPLPDLLVRRGVFLCEDSVFDHSPQATAQMVRLAVSQKEAEELLETQGELTKKQKNALKIVLDAGAATIREVMYFSGVSQGVVLALVKKEILEKYEKRVFRDPYKNIEKGSERFVSLSEEQQRAYKSLSERYKKGEACASLLFGITGSGKTQVFMRLIDDVRADRKAVIVLVPEISLTPQAVARFYARFGKDVAVLHSGLSLGERLDQWQRIKDGGAGIVVGTRSAVFAPLENLGLIIIDEEQEYTYKSESSPRYHARDVARFRCAYSKAMLLLASATPSVESFFAAQKGRYDITRLDKRFGNAKLPNVITVDMKNEIVSGNESLISRRLASEIEENLKNGQQSILLINRRGYNTFVSCAACGHVMTCPNCSIALTYHSANRRMMCHYCGYSIQAKTKCPECSGDYLKFSGTGTQKAEQTIEELFPTSKILRMDMDTTAGRYSHEKMLEKFGDGQYDIMIGTQMVAKGLDFANVTLVGVLSADQSLYMDDFRAAERTFSLLTQVVGRAGRSSSPGRAVIQTQTPDNEVLRLAAAQDYEAFYKSETALRRELLYPPFCDICEFCFTGISETLVKNAAEEFFLILKKAVLSDRGIPVRIMEPSPADIAKVAGRYRYRIIAKCRNDRRFRAITASVLESCGKNQAFKKVSVFADMNPLDLM